MSECVQLQIEFRSFVDPAVFARLEAMIAELSDWMDQPVQLMIPYAWWEITDDMEGLWLA